MRREHVMIALFLVLMVVRAAGAGVVIESFTVRPGVEKGKEVLSHLTNKGLIAEFLDPGNTGLGKSIGFLIWREVLSAISDQAGAGVIIAIPPGNQRIVDLLEKDYHLAAVEIARNQKCPMTLWGAVLEQSERIYLHSYLSLLPEIRSGDLLLRFQTVPGLEAEIPQTRFNFPLVETTRAELFNRSVVTRTGAVLRAAPNKQAAVVRQVAKDTALESTGMDGGWFAVRSPDGTVAFIENGDVDVPPRWVTAYAARVSLRGGPGKDFPQLKLADLSGTYKVLDMRYRPKQGLWYRVDIDGSQAWVAGYLVNPRFSLPVVHFMAGLYRYRARNYKEATKELTRFIDASGEKANNVNLATAHQLRGASRLFNKDPNGFWDFGVAVDQVPYDPAAYNLLALAGLSVESSRRGNNISRALSNLRRALELDRRNERALTLVRTLAVAIPKGTFKELNSFDRTDAGERLQQLQQDFPIAPR